MIASDTYTIFWREMKRYRKSRSGVLIRLIQPAIWIIVIGNTFAGTQPLIQSVGFEGEYIEFMTPGVIILTAIFTSIFGGVNTLWDRRYGFMNKALTSPISRSSIALGKMLAISLIAASQETFWGIINFLGMPLFMLSPALFPLELLPEWLGFAARLNPVTYTVLLVRGMMTGVNEGVNSFLSIGIIAAFVVAMIGLASYVFTREVNKPF